MSKMLEPSILEEDKGIKKTSKPSQNHCVQLIAVVMDNNQKVAADERMKTGDFKYNTVREVVDEVFDSRLEISLKDALAISSALRAGDKRSSLKKHQLNLSCSSSIYANKTIMENAQRAPSPMQ